MTSDKGMRGTMTPDEWETYRRKVAFWSWFGMMACYGGVLALYTLIVVLATVSAVR